MSIPRCLCRRRLRVNPKNEPSTPKTPTPVKIGNLQIAVNPALHSELNLEFDPVTAWTITGKDGQKVRESIKLDKTQPIVRFKTKEAAERFAQKILKSAEKLNV